MTNVRNEAWSSKMLRVRIIDDPRRPVCWSFPAVMWKRQVQSFPARRCPLKIWINMWMN